MEGVDLEEGGICGEGLFMRVYIKRPATKRRITRRIFVVKGRLFIIIGWANYRNNYVEL